MRQVIEDVTRYKNEKNLVFLEENEDNWAFVYNSFALIKEDNDLVISNDPIKVRNILRFLLMIRMMIIIMKTV